MCQQPIDSFNMPQPRTADHMYDRWNKIEEQIYNAKKILYDALRMEIQINEHLRQENRSLKAHIVELTSTTE